MSKSLLRSRVFNVCLKGATLAALFCATVFPLHPMHAAKEPAPAADKKTSDNPLMTESTLPYQMPPFDKIKNEHLLAGLRCRARGAFEGSGRDREQQRRADLRKHHCGPG